MTATKDETFPLAQPDRARPVPRPRRKRDYALAAIVLASLAIHASVFLPMLFTAKTAAPPSVETPVEVIQEPPPEPKKDPPKSDKDAAKEAQEKAEKAKADQAKAEQAKADAEQAKAEQAKADRAKAEADKARAEQAKAEQAKAEQDKADKEKAEQAKAEQAKAREKSKPPERKTAKAEPLKPQPQKAATPPESQAQVAERMRRLLGQPQSLDPGALPGESANGTEGATYEQLVMSRLTKALSMERRAGRPGYATVTFVLGEQGEVVSVDLARPSGDPLLDTEATAVVKRGAPYPTPPAGAKRSFTVTLQSRPVP